MGALQSLPLRLHIRARPGMYIGGTGARALRHTLDGVVTALLAHPNSETEQVTCAIGHGRSFSLEFRGKSLAPVTPDAFVTDAYEGQYDSPLLDLAITSAMSE